MIGSLRREKEGSLSMLQFIFKTQALRKERVTSDFSNVGFFMAMRYIGNERDEMKLKRHK
jgi:hypothetical protein